MGKSAQVVATDTQQRQAHISVQRYFEISLLLMLATGFLTVATTGKLDVVSMRHDVRRAGHQTVELHPRRRLFPRPQNRHAHFHLLHFLLRPGFPDLRHRPQPH